MKKLQTNCKLFLRTWNIWILARYSPEMKRLKSKNIEEALLAAVEILKIKRSEQIADGGKAA